MVIAAKISRYDDKDMRNWRYRSSLKAVSIRGTREWQRPREISRSDGDGYLAIEAMLSTMPVQCYDE